MGEYLDSILDCFVEGLWNRHAGLHGEIDGLAEHLKTLPEVDVLKFLMDGKSKGRISIVRRLK